MGVAAVVMKKVGFVKPKENVHRFRYVAGQEKLCFNPGCVKTFMPNHNTIIDGLRVSDDGTHDLAPWWASMFCSEGCGEQHWRKALAKGSEPRSVTTDFERR